MLSLGPDNLTAAQVALQLGVCRDTVYSWMREGVRVPATGLYVRLVPVRVGGRLRITPAALAQFIAAINPEVPSVELASEGKKRADAAEEATEWVRKRLGLDRKKK